MKCRNKSSKLASLAYRVWLDLRVYQAGKADGPEGPAGALLYLDLGGRRIHPAVIRAPLKGWASKGAFSDHNACILMGMSLSSVRMRIMSVCLLPTQQMGYANRMGSFQALGGALGAFLILPTQKMGRTNGAGMVLSKR